MKKILLALLCLCLCSTARACPPLMAFAAVQPCVTNAVLVQQQAYAVQVFQPQIAFASVGYGGFGGAFIGGGFGGGFARAGFGGVGFRGGFVGGGFRGPRVNAFARQGAFGASARVRVR